MPWFDIAVASTQKANESWPTFVHDFTADRYRILIRTDAPAQVHIHEMNSPPQKFLAQSRKDETHEVIALCVHIPEGTANENSYDFPSLAHSSIAIPPCPKKSNHRIRGFRLPGMALERGDEAKWCRDQLSFRLDKQAHSPKSAVLRN